VTQVIKSPWVVMELVATGIRFAWARGERSGPAAKEVKVNPLTTAPRRRRFIFIDKVFFLFSIASLRAADSNTPGS